MPNSNNKILKIIISLVVLIGIIHITAYYFHLYLELWWIDMLMHFLGGAWISAFALWFIFFSNLVNLNQKNNLPNFLITAFCMVLLVGIGWEIFEFKAGLSFFSPLTLSARGYWMDTISDVVLDLIGGIVVAIYFYRVFKNSTDLIKDAKEKLEN
mgnify:CR=1 FL=1